MYIRRLPILFGTILILSCAGLSLAQTSAGSVRGAVTDPTGAVLPGATVNVKNLDTNSERKLATNDEGLYNADNLPPGEYEVRIEAQGFQRVLQRVTVLTGNTHTADFSLIIGNSSETVTVSSEAAQINASDYKVDGVITRERIEALPLNGRNFLELGQLEPGVSVMITGNPGGNANSFTQVSVAGAGAGLTRITVDGGNVGDRVTGGSATNFSQETVREFQISTFNFDLSTGVTSTGAVSIISRTGTNAYHGSGFFFFRDHNIAAYPNLKRSATDPDPFFARRQGGFSVGGPVKKNKLFWFTNFEYGNQLGVAEISHTTTVGDGGAFAANFNHSGKLPLRNKLFNARLDYKVNDRHDAFLRYSEDHSKLRQFTAVNESSGSISRNNAYNALLGVTSVISASLINDARFNYNFLANALGAPGPGDCAGSIGCLGALGPQINVGGTGFRIGVANGLPTDRANRTYQLTDTVSWSKGGRRIRFGGEYERYVRFGSLATNDTGTVNLFGPEQVRVQNPTLYAALPASLKDPAAGPMTLADILSLPVQTFSIGVGDAGSPAPFNLDSARRTNRYRLFYQDAWQARTNFTLNYELAWALESNLRNYDLPKPQWLAALLGGGENLETPPHEYKNFSPALGFALTLGNEKKTVIRGGSGIYFDSDLGATRIAERRILGPSGNGRVVIDGTGIANPLFGQPGQPANLSPTATPTALTGQQVVNLIPQIKTTESARFGLLGDLSVRNIQLLKSTGVGQGIFSNDTRTPYSIQVNLGAQREVIRNLAVTADFVMRRGVAYGGPHGLFGVDVNRFNSVRVISVDPITNVPTSVSTRVLPLCANIAQRNDPNAQCSIGAFTIFQSAANFRYVGLHLKVDKRFSDRVQFTASYALSRYQGHNGVINLDNLQESYGIHPNDRTHRFNFSGIYEPPEYKGSQPLLRGLLNGWQISTINQFQSSAPANPILAIDVDGEGASIYTLPGIEWNGFGRGVSANDIRDAVKAYNADVLARSNPLPADATLAQRMACTLVVNGQTFCAPRTPRNQVYPLINLPAKFSNGDSFVTNDLRLTRIVRIREELRLMLIGEVFNIFNIANLGGYSEDLQSANFGIPTTRTNQVFGSGGPRAFQFAARLSF
ncbi:MAG TPA: carboxypeptidase regulatory-like domain-containing protein [Blastocatellia bacterium]|nr:carboxypeptidase regulatory-like domain-containing protein [Blastocatellia bacterium]